MSEDHNDYKIPLGELLTILKANGYGISIERILEIQSVLLSTPVFKLSLSELKFIITPVLARNDDDQKNIYKIIDAYIAQKVQRQEKTSHRSSLHIHRRTIFVLKVTGFFLIMATAVLLYTFQKKESAQKPIANYPKQFLPIDSSIANTNADRSTDTPTSKLKLADDIRQIMSNVAYSGKPIIPVRFNIILQVAAAFGLGLGAILYYFIFFERRKRMEAKKKAKEEEESFAAKKDNKTATAEEQLVHAVLQFPAKDFLIQKTKEFLTIRANLKKAALTGKANLAIKESVYATTKNAGFPSLAFDTRLKERKYLLLADKKEPGSHINHLFDFFINFLGSSKIHVVKFTYTSDIRMLNNRSGEIISLEDLSYDYPDYHLVIIGDCKLLLENDNPASQKDIDALFQRWTSKSIITPVPLHDWSDREDQFQKSSFNIVPGEIGAIELLTKAIAEDTQIKSEILENRLKNKYSVSKYAVKTANEVREYLNNEELFQVVCALAVYPKLNWNITLALFAAILRRNPGYTIKPDYDTLLKICRIPWLYSDRLDEPFRLQLFNFLKPETEIIARETILELLHEINPFIPKGSQAYKELQIQTRINSFFLYAHDPLQYKQYVDVKNEFPDYLSNTDEWALKERVENGLMPVNNKGRHETIEEFVLKEKHFEKRNVTFLRVALLTLPAATLYILFATLRPSFAYLDIYEKVSFIAIVKKDSTCRRELTQIVVRKLDKFDTIPLKNQSNVDYIRIDNVEYNRVVNLSFLFMDSTTAELPVEAKDSAVAVSLKCP